MNTPRKHMADELEAISRRLASVVNDPGRTLGVLFDRDAERLEQVVEWLNQTAEQVRSGLDGFPPLQVHGIHSKPVLGPVKPDEMPQNAKLPSHLVEWMSAECPKCGCAYHYPPNEPDSGPPVHGCQIKELT